MHFTWTHRQHIWYIEVILSELRNSFEEKKDHPHDCSKPDHKYSRGLGKKIKEVSVWEGHRDT